MPAVVVACVCLAVVGLSWAERAPLSVAPDEAIATCLLVGGNPEWEATHKRASFRCHVPDAPAVTPKQPRRIQT